MFGNAQEAPVERCSVCGDLVALADKLVVERETSKSKFLSRIYFYIFDIKNER